MPASSWARWRSRTSTRSTGSRPAISIDQKGASRNPRSTVGTVTEIYDHLRLLFARVGHPHCPNAAARSSGMTVQQIVDRILALPGRSRILVLGPLVRDRKTEGDRVFEAARRQGFVRVRVDGELLDLDDAPTLDKYKRHTIEVVVDRLVVRHADDDGRPYGPEQPRPGCGRASPTRSRRRCAWARASMVVAPADAGRASRSSASASATRCPFDGTTIDELEPRSFSFNSPHGACPVCTGLGIRLEFDIERVIPDRSRSIADGALAPWRSLPSGDVVAPQDDRGRLQARTAGTSTAPVDELPPEARRPPAPCAARNEKVRRSRYRHDRGENSYVATFEGVITNLERRYRETDSEYVKTELEKFMVERPCPTCDGRRLKPEVLGVTVDGLDISDVVGDVGDRRARLGGGAARRA